jgi:hypothetical protein
MSSTNTYTEQKYCVYITHYHGNKLPVKNDLGIIPKNYIGSSSIQRIQDGYKGSVMSKKYKFIWESELKSNLELFSIEIIAQYSTRREALWKELKLQEMFNVVKNPLFVNMSYARPYGYFGADKHKENNPNYKKSPSKETRLKQSLIMKGRPSKKKGIPVSSSITREKMSNAHKGNSSAAKYYEIIDPQNNKFIIKNLKNFCKANKLTYQLLFLVSKGKQTHHKKYKCKLISQ